MQGTKDRDLSELLHFQEYATQFGITLLEQAQKINQHCSDAEEELQDDVSKGCFDRIRQFLTNIESGAKETIQLMEVEKRKTQKEINDFNELIRGT